MRVSLTLHATVLALASISVLAEGQGTTGETTVSLARLGGEQIDCKSLSREFGRSFTAHSTEHFALIHPQDDEWAQRTGELLEEQLRSFYRLFGLAGFSLKPVNDPLVWIGFSSHDDFNAYARKVDRMDLSWLDGYYSARTNRVVFAQVSHPDDPNSLSVSSQPSLSSPGTAFYRAPQATAATQEPTPSIDVPRTTHEAAHQLAFNSGLLSRGVMYPLWVSEGLATNFEGDPVTLLERLRYNSERSHHLVELVQNGRLLDLDEFVTMTRVPLCEDEATFDAYAQSWGFFNFLITHRREALKHYLSVLAQCEPGERSQATLTREFTDSFGALAPLEHEWQQWLAALSVTGR